MEKELIIAFAFIAVMVGLFFLFRAIVLWYWKVDRIVENLETIVALLKESKT